MDLLDRGNAASQRGGMDLLDRGNSARQNVGWISWTERMVPGRRWDGSPGKRERFQVERRDGSPGRRECSQSEGGMVLGCSSPQQ